MKKYTVFFKSEKILFFCWKMLKIGRQARKRCRCWGGNCEFTSVSKGKIRLSDNSFFSLSNFLDVKLLLKWSFKIYSYFCRVLISYSVEWKFLELVVSLELPGIIPYLSVGSRGRKVFACRYVAAMLPCCVHQSNCTAISRTKLV